MGPKPSKTAPAGNKIIPYETPSKMLRSKPRKTAGSEEKILKLRWAMYEGCETALAPLVAVVQADLTRLRRDRFGAGRSGPGGCEEPRGYGGAGRVLYVCWQVPRRRDEVSVGGQVGIGIRPCWGTFMGVRRCVRFGNSPASLSESEGGNCEGIRMRIGGTVMVSAGLSEAPGLRLGSRDAMGENVFLSWRVSLEGPGRDRESVRRGRGLPEDLSTKELGTEDSSICES